MGDFAGVYRTGQNNGAPGALLASSFATNVPTLDKSNIERTFIEMATKEGNFQAGYSNKIQINRHTIYVKYEADVNCLVAVAAVQEVTERRVWDMVRDAIAELKKIPSDEVSSSKALGLNKKLKDTLKQVLLGKNDKLTEAQNQVDSVKMQMADNLNKVNQNVQNMETLESKAADLSNDAQKYQVQAKKAKWYAQKEHFKWMAIFGGIVLLVIIIICATVIPGGSKKEDTPAPSSSRRALRGVPAYSHQEGGVLDITSPLGLIGFGGSTHTTDEY